MNTINGYFKVDIHLNEMLEVFHFGDNRIIINSYIELKINEKGS